MLLALAAVDLTSDRNAPLLFILEMNKRLLTLPSDYACLYKFSPPGPSTLDQGNIQSTVDDHPFVDFINPDPRQDTQAAVEGLKSVFRVCSRGSRTASQVVEMLPDLSNSMDPTAPSWVVRKAEREPLSAAMTTMFDRTKRVIGVGKGSDGTIKVIRNLADGVKWNVSHGATKRLALAYPAHEGQWTDGRVDRSIQRTIEPGTSAGVPDRETFVVLSTDECRTLEEQYSPLFCSMTPKDYGYMY
jgi:hypothetical protein